MDIWDRALGFMDSQVLLTAHEMGVFEALEGEGLAVGDLALAVGLSDDSALRLLTALCALGLVERSGEGYRNSQEASAKLVRGEKGYMGAMFDHIRALYGVWAHFSVALREGCSQWERAYPGQVPDTQGMYDNPEALRRFMEGMHAITYGAAAEFAGQAPELGGVGSLVDVGGASGAFLIGLAEVHDHLKGTVFDLPAVAPIAEGFIRARGLEGRLRFWPGDFWNDDIPSGADAYALGFVLHDWDDDGQAILLSKIAGACREGGMLIVSEYLLNDERTGPLWAARADLNMLVAARGRERTLPEYEAWLRRFGFIFQRAYHASTGKWFMIFRRD